MARVLRMPAIAANAVEALLAEWPVAENTAFRADHAIATVETEKAVVDIPADADGVILKTLVHAGTAVKVGSPIAVLGDPGETVDDLDALLAELGVASAAPASLPAAVDPPPAVASASPTFVPPVAQSAPVAVGSLPAAFAPAPSASPAVVAASNGGGGRVFASPLARRLARESGLSIADLTGTGPGGRIVRLDVERGLATRRAPATLAADDAGTPAAVGAGTTTVGAVTGDLVTTELPAADLPAADGDGTDPGAAAPSSAHDGAAAYEDVPHSRMRRAIAARLTQSKRDAPHFSVRGTARVDRLLRLRARLNEGGSIKVSLNDLVVMAAARAHVAVPAMNVIWTPDAVRSFSSVDISVAVATERGLVTPVLRGVERLPVSAVAATTGDLIARARAGRLRQDELEGGTLTVTNLGVYGTEEFTAIINPPQSAILAVGAARQEPLIRKGRLAVGTVMRVSLSVDHRPVDGAVAARWMAAFLDLIEHPLRILT